MEQYQISREKSISELRKALKLYTPTYLFIRDCGGVREDGKYSCYGREKVGIDLNNRKLTIKVKNKFFIIYVDGEEVYRFDKDGFLKGFSVAYNRLKNGVMFFAPYDSDPNDENLPEVEYTMFREVIDKHLSEITFKEKILLEKDGNYWKLKGDKCEKL
jgi:hypothetical protein